MRSQTKRWWGGGVYSKRLKRTVAGEPLDVFYGRVWVDEERRYRYFRLGTKLKAARRRMGEILGNPAAASALRAAPVHRVPSMKELIDGFLDKYESRGDSGYYEHVAESWRAFFGTMGADRVTRATAEDYREHLRRKEYSDSTIRKYVGALGTLFRWGMGRGLVTANPVEGLKRPSEPDRNIAYLTVEQERAILDAVDEWARPFVSWCIGSGMRFGEALGLRPGDVDREQGLVKIDKSKTGKARAIPLNATLTAILRGCYKVVRLEDGGGAPEYVFHDREGCRLDKWQLYRTVEAAFGSARVSLPSGEKASVPKPSGSMFNVFRHTFGTRLARRGVPMIKIAQLMGNSVRIVEKHYAAFAPVSELHEVMASLDGPRGVAQDVARGTKPASAGSPAESQVLAG